MKLHYTVLLSLIISGFASGQQRTYFDEKWKPTDKANAHYYRLSEKKDTLYVIKDYYINGVLQFEGASKTEKEPFFLEGNVKYYGSDGQVVTNANMVHNKRHGLYEEFYGTGAPKVSGNFIDGKASGVYTEYYPTGQIGNTANFTNGKTNGTHTKYTFNGDVEYRLNYIDGVLNGPYESYEYGRLETKGTTKNGIQDGKCFTYYEDGSVRFTYTVTNGYLDGIFTEADKEGKLLTDAEFKNGVPIRYKSKRGNTINNAYFSNEMTLKNGVEHWKLLRDGELVMEFFYTQGRKSGIWKLYWVDGKELITTKDYTKADCEKEDYLQKVSGKFSPYVRLSNRFQFTYDDENEKRGTDKNCTEAIVKNLTETKNYNPFRIYTKQKGTIAEIEDVKPKKYTEPAATAAFYSKNNCDNGYKNDKAVTVCTRTFGKVTYKVFTSEDVSKLQKLQQEEKPNENEIYFFYQKFEEREYATHERLGKRYMGFTLPKGIREGLKIGAIKNLDIVYVLEHKFFNVDDFLGTSAYDVLEELMKKE